MFSVQAVAFESRALELKGLPGDRHEKARNMPGYGVCLRANRWPCSSGFVSSAQSLRHPAHKSASMKFAIGLLLFKLLFALIGCMNQACCEVWRLALSPGFVQGVSLVLYRVFRPRTGFITEPG